MSCADTPQISVIIPCYNYARYLPETVASIVAQTIDTWEIIIVDDSSRDETIEVAQRLIASYPARQIRLFTQPNSGPGAARNTGAQHARGEFLLFLDADDLLAPTLLAQTTAVLRASSEVGFVYTGMRLFEQDWHLWPSAPFQLETLLLDNYVLPHALVRRTAWVQVGGFDTVHFPQGFEDWDFWLRVAAAGWRGFQLRAPLIYYRRHGRGLSGKGPAHEWDLRAQIIRKHPQLYGARLFAWATARCALRGLRDATAENFAPPARAIAGAEGSHSPQAFALPQRASESVSLARRVMRMVPFRLRFGVQCWRRRVQLGLRATGFWDRY